MTTIEVTPSDLSEIVRVLKIKAAIDRERAELLIKRLVGVPFSDTHPNRDLAQAFIKQAHKLSTLAVRLEGQI